MRSARATLPVVLAALALGAWFLLRGGDGTGERAATRPPAEVLDVAVAPTSAELVPAGEGSTAGAGERTAVAEEAAPPASEGLVEIRDASSAPLAAAAWVVFRGEQVLAAGMTAQDGLARFALESGAGELAVVPRIAHVQRFPLDLAAERQTVALAAPGAVAGRVEIDGSEPAEPFELALETAMDPAGGLPRAVYQALSRKPEAPAVQERATGAGGAFRFDGLAPQWSGSVSWTAEAFLPLELEPKDVRFDHQRLELSAPDEDLRLALTTGSHLTGMVIDPATGAGIRAELSADYTFGRSTIGRGAHSEPDGTFDVTFPHPLPEHVELRVSKDGAGERTVGFDLPQDVRTHDVGTVAILATRQVAFEVEDEGGRPIEGAHVRAVPAEQASARSDAEGRGSLPVPPAAQRLRFAALGFEPVEVELPPGDEPVLAVLQAGTVLEVHLPPGQPRFAVQLLGSEPPFLNRGTPTWTPEVSGAESAGSWGGAQGSVSFRGNRDGVYVLSGIRPGIALTVRAVDRLNTPAAEVRVEPLRPGERRVLDLAVTAAPRVLAGRVVAAGGDPVPKADVSVGAVGSQQLSGTLTDASGAFRIDGLYASEVRLVAAAKGYATLAIEEHRVGEEPIELVLDAGRAVRVTVVGTGGAPVPNASVSVRTGASVAGSTSEPVEPGVYVLEHAPNAACTLVVDAGGAQFTRALAAGETEARVEVPAWRTCTVRVEGWSELPESSHPYVALRSLDAEPPRVQHQFPAGVSDAEVRFDVVFVGRYEVFVGRRAAPAFQEERLCATVELDVAADASSVPLPVTLVLDQP